MNTETIKRTFDVEGYWRVIVFYNIDYDFFSDAIKELLKARISRKNLRTLYETMKYKKAKAVTYSNLDKHLSIVLFNRHENDADYLNSIVHEAEHVKQAMLEVYQVEDKGELPAYTIGYLVMKMIE